MKKIWIGISIALVVTLTILLIVILAEKEPREIKIGAILPLTGDNAQWGIPPRNGAELAITEINKNGGIKGKELLLLVEDTRCEPKEGVSAINKLLTQRDLKILLGGVCSSVTLATAPIVERSRIILISPASTNPKITDAGDYIFRVIPSDSLRGKVFAEYIFNDLKISNVALLSINNEGGVGNRNTFVNYFTDLGGNVLIDESYEQNTKDMRTQITKIKSSKAEALVVVSYLGDTPLIMKQSRELGLTVPLYFQTEAVEDPNVLRVASNGAEGVIYILPAPAEGKTPERFRKLYMDKYGSEPELFAAEAYDAIHLIAKAMNSTKDVSVSTDYIRNYLYNVKDYLGASGTITFDKNGDVIKPMAIKMIKNGKPILLKVLNSK
ncbi:MAG: ABC transporter substrate-binding protein [Deltaproteobacteria bacterium]|nr:ABC transporter substrate-binding protein [Deltaproteobacteria bacterium]